MGLHEELTDALSRREDAEEAERELYDAKARDLSGPAGVALQRLGRAIQQHGVRLEHVESATGFRRADSAMHADLEIRCVIDAIDDDFLAPIRDLVG